MLIGLILNPCLEFIFRMREKVYFKLNLFLFFLLFLLFPTFSKAQDYPPKWSTQSQSTSIPGIGAQVELSTYWQDDSGLDKVWLSTNETGDWRNYTDIYLINLSSTPSGWSNFTWKNSSVSNGTMICWRIYANDTSGNENVTDEQCFEIKPTYLLVDLVFPSPDVYNENNPYIATQNSTFLVKVKIKCRSEGVGGSCNSIIGNIRYNLTSLHPNVLVNSSLGDKPFFLAMPFRRPIIINNSQNSNELTDYQVKLMLDTESLIAQGKMRSDCGDIRFVDSDGSTLLKYWIETGTCNSSNTVIWIKIPSIPASSTKTIYMFYGNPLAASLSNADDVFIFFDDFNSGVLDLNKWEEPYILPHPLYPSTTGGYSFDYSVGKEPPSIKFYTTGTNSVGRSATHSRPINLDISQQYAIDYWVRGERTGAECSGEQWILNSTKDRVKRYVYTCSIATGTYNFTPPTPTIYIRIDVWDTQAAYNYEAWHDYVRLRKYSYPEPTLLLGEEEIFNSYFCGELKAGEICNISWTINTTGDVNTVWTIDVNVSSSNTIIPKNNSENVFIRIGDGKAPKFFDASVSSTYAGNSVEHRLRWNDDTQLSGYIFSFDNCTGHFVNDSWVPFPSGGIEDWSNVSRVTNETIGCLIRWKVYANDTFDYWNVSQEYYYFTSIPPPKKRWSFVSCFKFPYLMLEPDGRIKLVSLKICIGK